MVDAAKVGDDLVSGFEVRVFCLPNSMKKLKRLQQKLLILLSHCNTLYKRCCTSFVNLGNPDLLGNPGFRLALAIASLAGMTEGISHNFVRQHIFRFRI
jgi:hypothetical protein